MVKSSFFAPPVISNIDLCRMQGKKLRRAPGASRVTGRTCTVLHHTVILDLYARCVARNVFYVDRATTRRMKRERVIVFRLLEGRGAGCLVAVFIRRGKLVPGAQLWFAVVQYEYDIVGRVPYPRKWDLIP